MKTGTRKNGGDHGVVFTKPAVVASMLDISGYTEKRNLSKIRVLDPAAGEGAFFFEILSRLLGSSKKFGFDFADALKNITAFEIEPARFEKLKNSFHSFLRENKITPAGIFNTKILRCADFLTAPGNEYDLVIGNPPYIRYEQLTEDQKVMYRKHFATFRHRSDLYIPFYEKSLRSLAPDGILCFICANRWLKNQYGSELRNYISGNFDFPLIINLEHTNPFEEAVAAYPAITLIKNNYTNCPTSYFELNDISLISSVFSGTIRPQCEFKITTGNEWSSLFNTETGFNGQMDGWPIEEQGFKIGIGVATGLDAVFLSDQFSGKIEAELLVPVIGTRDLKNNQLKWSGVHIINPFYANGKLINLTEFPKAGQYLLEHKAKLDNRYVARKNPTHWYKTIDKIDPLLRTSPKLLLPDISNNTFIFLDEGNFYPHHNIYYITGKRIDDLKILGAFLMSDLIRKQLSALGNKMNGGYIRWQSQNLRKLKLPRLSDLSNTHRLNLKTAFEKQDLDSINKIVPAIYSIVSELPLRKTYKQVNLF